MLLPVITPIIVTIICYMLGSESYEMDQQNVEEGGRAPASQPIPVPDEKVVESVEFKKVLTLEEKID